MGEAVNDRKESSAFSSTDADGLWCAIGVGRCTIDGVGEMRSERLSRDGLASANTSSSRNAAVLRKRKEKAKQCGQIRIGQVRDRKINSLWRNGRQGSAYDAVPLAWHGELWGKCGGSGKSIPFAVG